MNWFSFSLYIYIYIHLWNHWICSWFCHNYFMMIMMMTRFGLIFFFVCLCVCVYLFLDSIIHQLDLNHSIVDSSRSQLTRSPGSSTLKLYAHKFHDDFFFIPLSIHHSILLISFFFSSLYHQLKTLLLFGRYENIFFYKKKNQK